MQGADNMSLTVEDAILKSAKMPDKCTLGERRPSRRPYAMSAEDELDEVPVPPR